MTDNNQQNTQLKGWWQKSRDGVNQAHVGVKKGIEGVDQIQSPVAVNTTAMLLWAFVGVAIYKLLKEAHWPKKIIPGGRHSNLHNYAVGALVLGLAVAGGGCVHDTFIRHKGMGPTEGHSDNRIQYDSSQRAPMRDFSRAGSPVVPTVAEDHKCEIRIIPGTRRPGQKPDC